jgi:hypothetical protein
VCFSLPKAICWCKHAPIFPLAWETASVSELFAPSERAWIDTGSWRHWTSGTALSMIQCAYLCTTNPTNIDSAACRCVVAEHIRAHCSKRRKLKIPSNCASGRTRRRRQLWFFLRVSRVSYTSEWNKFLQMDGYRMRESHAAERKIELYQYWISLL